MRVDDASTLYPHPHLHLHLHLTLLLSDGLTTVLSYCSTIRLPDYLTTLLSYYLTTLLPYYLYQGPAKLELPTSGYQRVATVDKDSQQLLVTIDLNDPVEMGVRDG